MDIHTKYDIGDTVWALESTFDTIECPACNNGSITGKDNREYHCSACDGRGKAYSDEYYRPTKVVIGRVSTVHSKKKQRVRYSTGDDVFDTLYDEDRCYPTEAEAQAAADRLNASG